MDIYMQLIQKIKSAPRKGIVFPEGENLNIVKAAVRLKEEGLMRPILLGNLQKIRKLLGGLEGDGIAVLDPESDSKLEEFAKIYHEKRGIPETICKRMMSQPLFFGAMMVREGLSHGMLAGISCPTAEVIAVSELVIGLKKGCSRISSFYIMDIPGFHGTQESLLIFADPAVNPNPSPEELADIAVTTAESARDLLGWTPRVALLSFSTKGSTEHPDIEKVTNSLKIIHEKAPGLQADGELQADAALLPKVAKKKTDGESSVAGRANILIFPDLDAANISSKLVQILGKASSFGPILQGFSRPVSDLSRSATAQDIYSTALFVAAGK
jgi:phosphate acetyltransferase